MKKVYDVLNYYSFIEVPSKDKHMPLTLEGGDIVTLKPFMKEMTIEEIEYANYRSRVFKDGRLEFKKEDAKAIYKHLKIDDFSEIFLAEDVIDILTKPTKEKLERVVSIKDLNTIDRFLAPIVSVKTTGLFDISSRVVKVVETRKSEIYRNSNLPSAITIKKTKGEVEKELEEDAFEKAIMAKMAELEKTYDKKLNAKIKALEKKYAEQEKATVKE